MSEKNYLDIMIDSLSQKKDLLEKIVELNEKQEAIIDAKEVDSDSLDKTLREKDALIDRINTLDSGFEVLFARVREVLDVDRKPYSKEIETMKSYIRDITDLTVKIQLPGHTVKTSSREYQAWNKGSFAEQKKSIVNAKKAGNMASRYYDSMNRLDYSPQFMDKKN